MKCFYHSADLDGHCSGAIVKWVFPDCEMVGMDYGEAFPWDSVSKDDDVLMIDFSLQPFSDMVRLDDSCRLTWIDHHKSAIESYNEAYKDHPPDGSFHLDTNYSACELTWQYLAAYRIAFGKDTSKIVGKPMPEAVHLLGRYDIWKHAEVSGSLEFQYGMRSFANTWPDSPIWDDLFAGKNIDRVINDGVTLLQYEKNQNAKFMAAYGFETEFDGLRCIAANKGMGNSLVFDSMYDPEKHDAMLMFAWKNGQFTVSLYSTKPDVDVSVICKTRGGGGHKGAAGFQCDRLPFMAEAGVSND
jgi:oligoribonuclease NrnB/cAMP/cGMP phosphodiesterase (DHH superfamily)